MMQRRETWNKAAALSVAAAALYLSRLEPIAGQSPRRPRQRSPGALAFPKSVPDCSFPKWHVRDGETGKIALNDWLLSGARSASLNDRVWGVSGRPVRTQR